MGEPPRGLLVSRLGMRPLRCEIDDLTLMHAEDALRAARQQQRQMRERTEAAVAQQHIVFMKLRMDLRHPGHVVGVQRAGQGLQEHPRADVEQRQQMGHGEAAAGLLAAGLAEVLAEFGHVGHGETRAVDDEHPMPVPAPGVVDDGREPLGDAAEQLLEQRQRQATARLTVGRGGEFESAESDQMIDGRVAVEDLAEKQVNDGDGVKQTGAPSVADLAAGVEDHRSVELLGWGFLESAKNADDPVMH